MDIAQNGFGLSDQAMEDAIDDSQAMQRFVGSDLGCEAAPDATTLLKFRRVLQEQRLTEAIFATINAHLAAKGLMLRLGTVVDATRIAPPSSTKNRTRSREPEMVSGDESAPRTTQKGNQWDFGMKAHIGVDADSGLVHKVVGTAANVSDVTQASQLLHGEERDVFADAGDQGVDKRKEVRDRVRDRPVNGHVAMRPGKRRALDTTSPMGAVLAEINFINQCVMPILSD